MSERNKNQAIVLAFTAGAVAAMSFQRVLSFLVSKKGKANPKLSNNNKKSTTITTTAPHLGWLPPQPQPSPYSMMTYHSIDPTTTPSDVMYPLVISSIIPRPIAFVSTMGSDGSRNLAPYSYFNVVGHSPAVVAIGFCSTPFRTHGKKDSLYNILETKEFVVNIISEWFVEAANHCCGNFDYGQDEMQLSGLTPLSSMKIKPPRVKESSIQLECVLRHTYEAKKADGTIGSTIVIGEVVMWHVADGVAAKSPSGKLVVDALKLQPISRLGGNTYARTSGMFDLPRPDRTV